MNSLKSFLVLVPFPKTKAKQTTNGLRKKKDHLPSWYSINLISQNQIIQSCLSLLFFCSKLFLNSEVFCYVHFGTLLTNTNQVLNNNVEYAVEGHFLTAKQSRFCQPPDSRDLGLSWPASAPAILLQIVLKLFVPNPELMSHEVFPNQSASVFQESSIIGQGGTSLCDWQFRQRRN